MRVKIRCTELSVIPSDASGFFVECEVADASELESQVEPLGLSFDTLEVKTGPLGLSLDTMEPPTVSKTDMVAPAVDAEAIAAKVDERALAYAGPHRSAEATELARRILDTLDSISDEVRALQPKPSGDYKRQQREIERLHGELQDLRTAAAHSPDAEAIAEDMATWLRNRAWIGSAAVPTVEVTVNEIQSMTARVRALQPKPSGDAEKEGIRREWMDERVLRLEKKIYAQVDEVADLHNRIRKLQERGSQERVSRLELRIFHQRQELEELQAAAAQPSEDAEKLAAEMRAGVEWMTSNDAESVTNWAGRVCLLQAPAPSEDGEKLAREIDHAVIAVETADNGEPWPRYVMTKTCRDWAARARRLSGALSGRDREALLSVLRYIEKGGHILDAELETIRAIAQGEKR